MRQTNLWRESLRYREPALGGVAGLRRVTLSLNVCLGDRGVACIAEALKDDVWIKGACILYVQLLLVEPLHCVDTMDMGMTGEKKNRNKNGMLTLCVFPIYQSTPPYHTQGYGWSDI